MLNDGKRKTEKECIEKSLKWVEVKEEKKQGVCNFKKNLPKEFSLNTPKACFDWAYYNKDKERKQAIEDETKAL